MNSSLTTPKTLWIISVAASVAALAVVVGSAVLQYPASTFGLASTAAVFLIMAHDYAPRRRRWTPRLTTAQPAHRAQRFPLAS
jgi:hypothetical protein